MIPSFDQILYANVNKYQCPGDMILILEPVPVCSGPLSDVVEQIHIKEQENMVPESVASEHVDVKSRIIPDLYHGKSRQGIRKECLKTDKSAFNMMKPSVVQTDDLYTY